MNISGKEGDNMACPLCKGNMVPGATILPFDMKNGKIIVVLNVPALVCEQCGEEYVEMGVTRNVEGCWIARNEMV